ncbi:MAG: hypothetical protein L3J20_08805 [Flavobacteriaceae bacterium]|nr:hypothetical protein [Flavobacteriaceae bacterium]
MKNVIPKFKRPLKSIDEPTIDITFWDKATNAYDAKDYKKAVVEVINYINPSLLQSKDTSKDINIVQGQGSAEIQVNVTNEKFSVKAPFLRSTEATNKIALFRKIAEVNFNPLTLAQIHLKDDTLWFGYETSIELCQPYKTYEVLREICVYADNYDDEFVGKYKADFYKESNTTKFTSEEKDKAWNQINDVLTDYKEYSQFFKEKRWDAFQWDIIVISILKIVNMPYVQGALRTDLQEYVSNMYNGNIDFNFRIDKGTNFMNKLCAKSRDEFMKEIYHAENFISLKWRSSTEIMQNYVKKMERNVLKYIEDKDNFTLSYYLQYSFLYIIYSYNLEDLHKNSIYDVLEEVSGLEPNIAAEKLLITYYDFLENKKTISSNAEG